ncbi:MAG: dihydroorotate dehydrogenase electron transfer subunit [Thermoplasmata archaeon]|nr:dihydroorotate dehydrogenase electron transfer subunit [Thermoplasmata archaeon]MCI4359831.1 dihydroorotate dehydrogenase electron transfer subunit [Thermoplasmata archaeon]
MREVVAVSERVQETPSTVTLRFAYPDEARPGQFVMLWIPGDDEIPMSLSYVGRSKGVTVKVMGSTSRHIQSLAPGAQIGVRGPYGNAFDLAPRRVLVVAGGSGAAVLAPAAEAAARVGSEVTAALGATTGSELLFEARFRQMGARVELATDDGSIGARGFVTGVSDSLLASTIFDAVWTCGPEVMMDKVIRSARRAGVPAYGSVERVMKCALGMCDACALGPYHVCVDGPVFPGDALTPLPEFGRFKREPSGRVVPH